MGNAGLPHMRRPAFVFVAWRGTSFCCVCGA